MKLRSVIKIMPVLIPSLITLTFFIWPLCLSIEESVHSFSGDFVGLQNYIDAINDPAFVNAFVYTLRITIIVLIITMISSIILAVALRRSFIGKKLVIFLLQTDVAIPSLACATMMILFLSQSGFLSAVLNNLGIINRMWDFPNIFFKSDGVGVIVCIVWLFVPYITLSLLSVLHSVSNEQDEQAATLGVWKIRRFFHITLPTLKPAIAYSSVLCFASVFSAFELPSLVGDKHSLVTLAYYYYNTAGFTPGHMEAYSIAMIVTIISLTVSFVLMYYSLTREEKS
ncbi:MAG: sugar ABC transporter permease [Candidatus Methanomethylophilaceae archaeon]|nr:sugar ABC transporter permease [Candidatus Methanomethylophilaceae archaeon]